MELGCLNKCGFLSSKDVAELSTMPSAERISKGPVAIIECIEDIPCNPCEASCKFGAIKIGDDITALPQFFEEKCTGCGVCIYGCPGLAIFMIDGSKEGNMGTLSFPHEFLPLPTEGQIVDVVNRAGEVVCKGTVEKVLAPKISDRTPVVQVQIPKNLLMEARGIKRL
jgi:Fe-S-cluster-containing hydrogenase component 2